MHIVGVGRGRHCPLRQHQARRDKTHQLRPCLECERRRAHSSKAAGCRPAGSRKGTHCRYRRPRTRSPFRRKVCILAVQAPSHRRACSLPSHSQQRLYGLSSAHSLRRWREHQASSDLKTAQHAKRQHDTALACGCIQGQRSAPEYALSWWKHDDPVHDRRLPCPARATNENSRALQPGCFASGKPERIKRLQLQQLRLQREPCRLRPWRRCRGQRTR